MFRQVLSYDKGSQTLSVLCSSNSQLIQFDPNVALITDLSQEIFGDCSVDFTDLTVVSSDTFKEIIIILY
jgi:hypothetical protein